MLDKRLKRMEERVIKIIPKEEQGILTATGRATVRPSTQATQRRTSTSKKRAAEQSLTDLESWSRSNDVPPETAVDTVTIPETLRTHQGDEQSLLKEGVDKLPSMEVQEHLAEVFFDYVYGQSYHLLHKPSFMRRLARGEIAPVLVLAVCAISARFSDHPDVRTEPAFLRGEDWAAAARDISTKRYDSPNITLLIVYLILTLHEFGTCQGVRSWMFSGMAQRMAYAMQLHHDLARDPCTRNAPTKTDLSYTDREIRRRTMWACFMTDRYCSSGTERPTFISVEHLRLQLPIREIYFQMELTGPTENLAGEVQPLAIPADEQLSDAQENMGVAAYMIRMVAIWGDCINYYNMGGKAKETSPMWDEGSKFQELRRAIRKWHETLPDSLRYRPDNLAAHASEKIANQFIFMHIIYHQTALFVNRFALPLAAAKIADTDGVPANFVQDAATAALEAANKVSALVHEGMDHNLVAPFAGYSAFFSSTVHIQGAFSNNQALVTASNKHLTWNINYLTKMKKHWGMFHFMTENLRDLYRKHVDAARHAAKGSDDDKAGEPIFQYGDWFDRYPHGVTGADYDEPHSSIKKEPGADAGLGQQSDLQTVEEFFSKLSPRSANVARVHKARKTAKRQPTTSGEHVAQNTGPDPQLNMPYQPQQDMNDLYTQLTTTTDMTSPLYASGFNQAQQSVYGSQLDGAYLDRQSALIYAGFDPNIAMGYSMPGTSYDPNNVNMNLGLGALPDMSAGQNTYQAAASGGWLMPMNLDAAALAEASGPFSTGSFDWTTQFELASLQTNPLTPRTQMELDVANARSGMNGG